MEFFSGEKKGQPQYTITSMRTTVETWWNIVNFAMFYSYKDFKTKLVFHFKPPNSQGVQSVLSYIVFGKEFTLSNEKMDLNRRWLNVWK